jgi:hypothetical protein
MEEAANPLGSPPALRFRKAIGSGRDWCGRAPALCLQRCFQLHIGQRVGLDGRLS